MRSTLTALTLLFVLAGGCAASSVRSPLARPRSATRSASRAQIPRAETIPVELRDLCARINRQRLAIGCASLRWDDQLAAVARHHSEDMVRRGYFDHEDPDGLDPFDRMRRAGIPILWAAENIASGQRTGAETFEGWMASPGHRKNLENCIYTRIGLGLDHNRWTCTLARLEVDGRPHEHD